MIYKVSQLPLHLKLWIVKKYFFCFSKQPNLAKVKLPKHSLCLYVFTTISMQKTYNPKLSLYVYLCMASVFWSAHVQVWVDTKTGITLVNNGVGNEGPLNIYTAYSFIFNATSVQFTYHLG